MSRRVSALLLLTIAVSGCTADPVEAPDPGLAVAPLNEVESDSALYNPTFRLWLTNSDEFGLIAVSERDPHLGCRVSFVDDRSIDFGVELESDTRFLDPCHGSQYDMAGRYLAGPSEADLTRIDVAVFNGVVYLTTDS